MRASTIRLSASNQSWHYGSSWCFNFCLHAAVAQENIGHTYVADVCEKAGLSPSKHARAHGECMDKQGKKKALWQSRKEIKRRRLELKEI